MRRLLAVLVLVIAGLTTASVAGAATSTTFVAVLSPVAGCPTSGRGVAIVTVTDEGRVQYRLIAANLQNVTMAHIHRSDTGGGVAWLYNPTSPVDVHDRVVLASGTITTADLMDPTITSVEQLAKLLLDQTDELSFYVNVHTSTADPSDTCEVSAISGDLVLHGSV
jgi:CHRD domain